MPRSTKKMAPVELQLAEAEHRNPSHQEGETMTTSLPKTASIFDARFLIDAEFGPITVESEREYIARFGGTEAVIFKDLDLVRIDNGNDVIHVDAAEALQLAAAIQAVAIDMLEQQPRYLKRRTEPGNPHFEEAI